MSTSRNTRPLTARSVVASTLLGLDPPRLAGQLLVRSGELFGIAEGATRTALSRMVAAGELVADDGGYHLAGRLLDRQERQTASRRADRRTWDGTWVLALVVAERRSATERSELREAMRILRLAEWREGLWVRPDNLDPQRAGDARAVVDAQCSWVRAARPDDPPLRLWPLDGWAGEARALIDEMDRLVGPLEQGDLSSLADGFVASAAVLRHFQADPLLPDDLLPSDWPGEALRRAYDRYDEAFRRAHRAWFRSQR